MVDSLDVALLRYLGKYPSNIDEQRSPMKKTIRFKRLSEEAEAAAKKYYDSISEKDKRRYAATLYLTVGPRSMTYICQLLGVNHKTIRKGLSELSGDIPNPDRQRNKGGGRKNKCDEPDLNEAFCNIIKDFTAGDPMDESIKYTSLSKQEIVEMLALVGHKVSRGTVSKLLKKHGFKKRKIQKRKSLKSVQGRDAQFHRINSDKEEFHQAGDPVISVDTKKKEAIGDNHREGECYANGQLNGPDHTYGSLNDGKAVPHGIYDLYNNHATIHIGTSNETAEFIVDSILLWWATYGLVNYPDAKRILILIDSGGANSYRHHIFKKELQRLADGIGIAIHIKHYPSYTSKWNPIEHRVFPHVSRVIKGVFIRTFDEFKKLVERAKTKTGLKVIATIIDKVYEKGKTATIDDVKQCTVTFDADEPRWNYIVSPAACA